MSDMAMGVNDATGTEVEFFRRVSWGAIFGGVLTALGVELIFLSFGLFIGFQMTNGGGSSWTTAWYLVSVFFSLFFGAWVAAKLTGNPDRGNGMLHGVVVWGLSMFTTAVIATAILWDVIRMASSWLQTAVSSVAPAAGAVPPQTLNRVAENTANDLSTTALVIFFGLLLALAASLIGGAWAVRKDIGFLHSHTPHRHLPEQPHHA
jgi:hypothetical protein